MIQEVSEVSEDISFFEGLAMVVRQAREKDPQLVVQAEIIRRARKCLLEEKEEARKKNDHFKLAVLEIVRPLSKDVLSRALSGIDMISYWVLWQIGLALGLDKETMDWLEVLRQLEEPRNHSTTQQRVIVVTERRKQPRVGDDDLPPWIHQP